MTTVPASGALPAAAPYRLKAAEIACGFLGGTVGSPPLLEPGSSDPIKALEQEIRPALENSPCLIMFSGGRDSSAVLAIATRLARRESLPAPIPVTHVFPHSIDADEVASQEVVVGYLQAPDWVRIAVTDERDVLGPRALEGLHRYGLVYPPTAHSAADVYAMAAGGTVLTGEGGDEVLGPMRGTPLANLRYRRGATDFATIVAAAQAVAPRLVRRMVETRQFARVAPPWLRPQLRAAFIREIADDAADEPLSYADAVRRLPYGRSAAIGLAGLSLVAAGKSARLAHPLLAQPFLDALARRRGRLGYPTRTAAMTELFGDVLPAAILSRRTKATFNTAAINEHSRRFAGEWDGSGLDQALVDVDVLRAEWLSLKPNPGCLLALQAAWLATEGSA
ncbi:MAG: asparagine synthase-related protein [Actinomycetota bacterium]